MMSRIMATVLVGLLLGGCAGAMITQTVEVPVPVPCEPPQTVPPSKPIDSLDPAKMTAFEAERALWATIEALEGYTNQVEAAVDACRKK